MRTCAYAHGYPPYTFFSFTYFFRRRMSAVLSVFLLFGGSLRVVSAECVLCVVRCFFWVFVCCFLIPGLCRGLFGDFGLFCGICLMLAKMMECQCESVQIEGVSGVMPGIFGVIHSVSGARRKANTQPPQKKELLPENTGNLFQQIRRHHTISHNRCRLFSGPPFRIHARTCRIKRRHPAETPAADTGEQR